MQGKEDQGSQALKTGGVIAAVNALLYPFYWADRRLGVTATIVASLSALYALHEVGKAKRPDENAAPNAGTFFAPKRDSSDAIDNAFQNIVTGGAAVCDQFSGAASTSPKQ